MICRLGRYRLERISLGTIVGNCFGKAERPCRSIWISRDNCRCDDPKDSCILYTIYCTVWIDDAHGAHAYQRNRLIFGFLVPGVLRCGECSIRELSSSCGIRPRGNDSKVDECWRWLRHVSHKLFG
jgi:hypothetical protein